MPFIFEQPNLDRASESHLYFDPGDGRLITVFTDESRKPDPRAHPDRHRLRAPHRLLGVARRPSCRRSRGSTSASIKHSGVKDRGFMDSIYFEDPLGLLIELASYRFEPPAGFTHADVLMEAHKIRVARGDYNIAEVHLADAIEALDSRERDDRSSACRNGSAHRRRIRISDQSNVACRSNGRNCQWPAKPRLQ